MNYWKLTTLLLLISPMIYAQGYNVNGDASDNGGDCYTLTPPLNNQSGSIWYTDEVDLNEVFDVQFTVNFGPNESGADGMVFVFQQVSNTVLGTSGGDIGFGGFEPSLGVEFDIYHNSDRGDIVADHTAILINGSVDHGNPDANLAGPIQASATDANIEDGEDHTVQILWDPSIQLFTVFFDCEMRLELTYDIVEEVFDGDAEVFWGFTGATGGQVAEQVLCLDPYILGLPETYTACPGDEVQLTFSETTNGTYSWEPAEYLNDPTIPNPIAIVNDTTTFVLTYTDLCGETEIDSTTIETEYLDINAGQDFNLCPGNSQEILLPEGNVYTWSNGFVGNPIIIDQPGTYYVDATQGNCFGSDTVVVGSGTDVIGVSYIVEPTICGESDGSLTITDVQGTGGPYIFDIGGTPQTDTIFNNLDSGNYTLTATSPDGCIFTENFTIQSELLVQAGFLADPTSGTAPLTVNLTDLSSNRSDFYYLVDGTVAPNTESITFTEYGTYTISQWAWNNSLGCLDTVSVQIVVDAFVDLIVPNIVTPNGDGKNDKFTVKISGISHLEAQIFNRWGIMVHETVVAIDDLDAFEIWDPVDYSQGVYYYVISATDLKSQKMSTNGTIEVVSD